MHQNLVPTYLVLDFIFLYQTLLSSQWLYFMLGHALPKVALNRQLPLKNLVCYIMASINTTTKLGVHFCENYLRIYHKCCPDETYLFQKPGQICECTNHQQKQPSKILMNFKGGMSVSTVIMLQIISIFLYLFFW